ncbi:MAG: EAL domain-containing protein [Clostridiales bacterium]|nr:EAL domain-containing protein [Clostridiales bacterium]
MDLSMKHWYQPIYHLKRGNIIGYEALLRSDSDDGRSPADMFRQAEANGKRPILDRLSILLAVSSFKDNPTPLFVNVFSDTLLETGFIDWWDKYRGKKESLILELSECESVYDWEKLKYVVKHLRRNGIKIAIDEMGTGFDSLLHCLELDPDYFKLEKVYVTDLMDNPNKQRVITHLLRIYRNATEFVAVGVERQDDLEILAKIGVTCVQGYVLSRPVPLDLISSVEENLENITKALRMDKKEYVNNQRKYFRLDLATPLCSEMTIVLIKGRKVNIKSTHVCIKNISAGGLMFFTSLKIPVNNDIILGFKLEILGKQVMLQGNIVRNRVQNENSHEYGVQFIIDEAKRSEILKLIYDVQIVIRRNLSFPDTSVCNSSCGLKSFAAN